MPASNGQRAETHAAFRFAVQIDGITEAVFTECTLPALEVEVHEQPEGGLNNAVHQIPGRIRGGKITLKRGLTSSSDLLSWYMDVAQGQIEASQREVSIVMYDSTASEIMRWNFAKAFPSKWSGPSLSSGSNQVAIETLELSYQSVDVE
ncbi:MAG: phage tail protein [Anaerolineae bacterium]